MSRTDVFGVSFLIFFAALAVDQGWTAFLIAMSAWSVVMCLYVIVRNK